MTNKVQNLKGFRDFLPKEMRIRKRVTNILEEVFESFGFEPIETPSLEYADVLLGKYGGEADKLVYTFTDNGGRDVGLRYDMTVPTAKVLTMYRDRIKLPFKRYQIQRAWRADKPQKGRYREFTQCDIDILGSGSPLADAEIIAIIYTALSRIGFRKFTIRVNSRQVLFGILEQVGISEKEKQLSVLNSIDKLDKKSIEEIQKELQEKGFRQSLITNLFQEIKDAKPDENLQKVLELAKNMGVREGFIQFDPTLARGLDYYTGSIFETVVEEPKIGSITGGGRYDQLIRQLGGPDVLATGTTIGLDRVCDVIMELGLDIGVGDDKVLVTVMSNDLVSQSLQVADILRSEGVDALVYPNLEDNLSKQLSYADGKGFQYVIIVGLEEVQKEVVQIKDMKSGTKKDVRMDQIINWVKEKIYG